MIYCESRHRVPGTQRLVAATTYVHLVLSVEVPGGTDTRESDRYWCDECVEQGVRQPGELLMQPAEGIPRVEVLERTDSRLPQAAERGA